MAHDVIRVDIGDGPGPSAFGAFKIGVRRLDRLSKLHDGLASILGRDGLTRFELFVLDKDAGLTLDVCKCLDRVRCDGDESFAVGVLKHDHARAAFGHCENCLDCLAAEVEHRCPLVAGRIIA